jgi:hypothetical protein
LKYTQNCLSLPPTIFVFPYATTTPLQMPGRSLENDGNGQAADLQGSSCYFSIETRRTFFLPPETRKKNKEEGGQMLFVGVQLTPPSGILSPPPIRRTPS